MALISPEEQVEIERNLAPRELYEFLFSDKTWAPRTDVTEVTKVVVPSFHDGKTPEELEESIAKRKMAINLREAAVKAGKFIELTNTPKEDVLTTERALLRYGAEITEEQGLPVSLALVAEVQVNELLAKDHVEVIDVPSLALGALALERMEMSDEDPIERKAATQALGSLPHNPEQIDLVKHLAIGHDTGELAVRAIVEHQLVSA